MKSTFNVLFFLKKDKQKANGNVPIMCRVTVDGVATRFNSKLEIHPDRWNTKASKVIGNTKETKDINLMLDKIRMSIFNIYHNLQDRDNTVSPEKIKYLYLGFDQKMNMLLDLFQKHKEDTLKLVGISLTKATYRRIESGRQHLENYIQLEYQMPDISLRDINNMFVRNFETYMLSTAGCNVNTTACYLTILKRLLTLARNNGLLNTDPFATFKIRYKKVDRGYLTREEVDCMLQTEFSLKRLERVRDLFIFSCYTGLAYVDVKKLGKENVRTSFDGNMWIMTNRQKTQIPSNIPLLEIPAKILEKYKDKLPNEKILPTIQHKKVNFYLKEIASLCGITKRLSFHLARHTFATTTTLANDVPIETVSKMLGHTSIKTTQIYARITNSKVSKDMMKLAEKLKVG